MAMPATVDQGAKGNQLMAEAEQKLVVPSGGCCKSKPKVEEACDLYVKAANAYKMAKDWNAAGNAFAEAATLELKNKRPHEAGSHFAEAAKCYRKVNLQESANYELKAAEVYTDMGRLRVAAKHHQAIAEIFEDEGEGKDLKRSVEHYIMAAEFFAGEESGSKANKCWNQVANHSAILGDYKRAADIYERIAKEALGSSLLRYTANDLYLRAGLCRLKQAAVIALENPSSSADPAQSTLETIARYEDDSPAFGGSREKVLLHNLAQAFSENSLDAFNEAVRSHESVSRLDRWYHDLFRSLRKHIGGDPDLR